MLLLLYRCLDSALRSCQFVCMVVFCVRLTHTLE